MKKEASTIALQSIKDEAETGTKLSASVMEVWDSLPYEVRSALVSKELNKSRVNNSESFVSLAPSSASSSTSTPSESDKSGPGLDIDKDGQLVDRCKATGAKVILEPLDRAPKNVYRFVKSLSSKSTETVTKGATKVKTTTQISSNHKGWRNIFNLPISYDVNIFPRGSLLDPSNPQLLLATGPLTDPEEGNNRRFACIDKAVHDLYGKQIKHYFESRKIDLNICILNGGEADKRPEQVDILLDALCDYKLRRREPFLAIGGGCLLDIAGMAACLYRRGVPFVRVPTTLLAIVDASVGVKNGVDYCCGVTDETYKNRVGSFYAPSSCLLDPLFIATQDERNISNGMGEVMKLALVRSSDLFELLESYGEKLIESRFGASGSSVPTTVTDRIIELSIQIMLEELGPNLWEEKLERCVDYGHTFSKLLEMVPGSDVMHGEAVNIDGFFSVILSFLRGFIDRDTVQRVYTCMHSLQLPTHSRDFDLKLALQSCNDAIEHRHGAQRIPLITDIGESICVSDITEDELDRALEFYFKEFPDARM